MTGRAEPLAQPPPAPDVRVLPRTNASSTAGARRQAYQVMEIHGQRRRSCSDAPALPADSRDPSPDLARPLHPRDHWPTYALLAARLSCQTRASARVFLAAPGLHRECVFQIDDLADRPELARAPGLAPRDVPAAGRLPSRPAGRHGVAAHGRTRCGDLWRIFKHADRPADCAMAARSRRPPLILQQES